ncbi:unnamed protein product [Prorocentrum cordatum]|uniref:RanBP2-type domain-containing protein n=1 Tax=Prorocentrum cordatum TaxID=2364126 RepID=A0ABN9X704_9DINO|nr:unnamed protein product [Polarella glacialis]
MRLHVASSLFVEDGIGQILGCLEQQYVEAGGQSELVVVFDCDGFRGDVKAYEAKRLQVFLARERFMADKLAGKHQEEKKEISGEAVHIKIWQCPSCGAKNFGFRESCMYKDCNHKAPETTLQLQRLQKLQEVKVHSDTSYMTLGELDAALRSRWLVCMDEEFDRLQKEAAAYAWSEWGIDLVLSSAECHPKEMTEKESPVQADTEDYQSLDRTFAAWRRVAAGLGEDWQSEEDDGSAAVHADGGEGGVYVRQSHAVQFITDVGQKDLRPNPGEGGAKPSDSDSGMGLPSIPSFPQLAMPEVFDIADGDDEEWAEKGEECSVACSDLGVSGIEELLGFGRVDVQALQLAGEQPDDKQQEDKQNEVKQYEDSQKEDDDGRETSAPLPQPMGASSAQVEEDEVCPTTDEEFQALADLYLEGVERDGSELRVRFQTLCERLGIKNDSEAFFQVFCNYLEA